MRFFWVVLVFACLTTGCELWQRLRQWTQRESPDPQASFAESHPKDFRTAKKLLRSFQPRGLEIYCGCAYDLARKRQLDNTCGFKSASTRKSRRAHRIEWEHVVPASRFGVKFKAWKAGHPDCRNNGKSFRGRRCARKVSEVFRKMEADLFNLLPAIGELNGRRSNFEFAIIPGELMSFGNCDFEIQKGKVEPRPEIRGDIARIYFYMDRRYSGLAIIDADNRDTMQRWAREDPITQEEIRRVQRIQKVQPYPFFEYAAATAH